MNSAALPAENGCMKFYPTAFLLLVLLSAFNISCSKADKTIEEKVPEIHESFVSGKILSKSAELCLFGRDFIMHSVIKLSAGDDVAILELDGKTDTKLIQDSNAEQPADSENQENLSNGTEYVHVVYDNMDFWLEKSVFALNCESAVAIEKTFLYSDPSLSQKIETSQNPLRFSSLIAKSVEKLSDENPESVKVFYYDLAKKSVQEAYVLSSSISTLKDDIVVSQIAESLKTTKRAVPRNELFLEAAKYKPCQKVLAVLNEQKVEKKTYSYQEVLKSMQKMSFGVNVEELLTVDQSKDPFQ